MWTTTFEKMRSNHTSIFVYNYVACKCHLNIEYVHGESEMNEYINITPDKEITYETMLNSTNLFTVQRILKYDCQYTHDQSMYYLWVYYNAKNLINFMITQSIEEKTIKKFTEYVDTLSTYLVLEYNDFEIPCDWYGVDAQLDANFLSMITGECNDTIYNLYERINNSSLMYFEQVMMEYLLTLPDASDYKLYTDFNSLHKLKKIIKDILLQSQEQMFRKMINNKAPWQLVVRK